MKKLHVALAGLVLTACLAACDNANTNKTTDTQTSDSSANDISNNTNNNVYTSSNASTNAKLPLTPADSTFVMKAAIGGTMEVEAGNIAQQNAQSERVKSFGRMMVQDHQAANQELMSIASGRGMNVQPTLPPEMQKHTEQLRKMKGKAFDNHYMSMMVSDHQKTLAEFEKQANGGGDTELKGWAQKTLPTLQKHRDSAVAINKAIK